MYAYIQTAKLAAMEKFQGGVLGLIAGYFLRALALVPLLFLWRGFAAQGADLSDFTLNTLLSYTWYSALLSPMLSIQTPLTFWNYQGGAIDLYRRPMGLFGQVIAQTAGGWLPALLLYALPMLLAGPLLGIEVLPKSPWFLPSLLMTVSLGFALDILYFCLLLRLQNIMWLSNVIRLAVAALFSGAVIPLALLPWGLGDVFALLPFGSLANAPLTLVTGTAGAAGIIPLQLLWNVLLWALAYVVFVGSRERMVSYGG